MHDSVLLIICFIRLHSEKILRKITEVIAANVPSEDFEFFCQKLQLGQADIEALQNTRLGAAASNSTFSLDVSHFPFHSDVMKLIHSILITDFTALLLNTEYVYLCKT